MHESDRNNEKTLFIVGAGLGSPKDLSVSISSILRCVEEVYFEIYTNFSSTTIEQYESYLHRKIYPIYRKKLENESKIFLDSIKDKNAALLISGDPFIATTHFFLFVEAQELGIKTKIINNISIHSLAPSLTGLSSYKFGKTATIPFKQRIISTTPYEILKDNMSIKAHTLLLLDVDLVNDKFLSINKAIDQLFEMETQLGSKIIFSTTKAIALCKLGTNNSKILYDTLENLNKISWKEIGPPQALIVPAELKGPEEESVRKMWSATGYQPDLQGHKKKIVVTGTFDVIHPGHLAFFQQAKKILIPAELWVIVARNSSVTHFKHHAPILDEKVRQTMLNALEIVDKAILGNEGKDKIKIIEEINPDLIVLGYDQWIDEEKLKTELKLRNLKSKVLRLSKYGDDGYSSSSAIRERIAKTFNEIQEK